MRIEDIWIGMLIMLILTSASSATLQYPSCLTNYPLNGFNFVLSTAGQPINCPYNTSWGMGVVSSNYTSGASYFNTGQITEIITHPTQAGNINISNAAYPVSNTTYNLTSNAGGTGGEAAIGCNLTNGTTYKLNATSSASSSSSVVLSLNLTSNGYFIYQPTKMSYNITCPSDASLWYSAVSTGVVTTFVTFPQYNATSGFETNPYQNTAIYNATPDTEFSIVVNGNNILRHDAQTHAVNRIFNQSDLVTPNLQLKANLYYGSTAIIPKITYIPDAGAFPYAYNSTSGYAYLRNGSVSFVLDNLTNVWYFCPATTVYSYPTIYTLSCIYYPQSGANTTSFSFPLTFLVKQCYQDNNNFTWNIVAPSSQTYNLYQWYNNGSTPSVTTFNGAAYTSSRNVQSITNLSIYIGTQQICAWSNQTTTFLSGMPIFQNSNLTKMGGTMMMIAGMAMATVTPTAAVFVFMINDQFGFIPTSDMFAIFGLAFVTAMMVSYFGDKTLKSLGMYIAIGVGYLSYVVAKGAAVAGIPAASSITALQSSLNNFTSQPLDLWSFAASAIGFIVNFGAFLITLPLTIYNMLFTAIQNTNPNLYNAVSGFQQIILVGIFMWIALKLYEIISNRFRGI